MHVAIVWISALLFGLKILAFYAAALYEVLSSLLAAVGGLLFIAVKGTTVGTIINIGFSLYGVVDAFIGNRNLPACTAERMEKHRAWALRLYALAIGSWLYRMDYGFWLLLSDGLGHSSHFTGPFNRVISFFYIPNLMIAKHLYRFAITEHLHYSVCFQPWYCC